MDLDFYLSKSCGNQVPSVNPHFGRFTEKNALVFLDIPKERKYLRKKT
jgi:hypothetical protein